MKFKAKILDFQSPHPDFQQQFTELPNSQISFVQPTLNANGNPQLLADVPMGAYVKDAASFDQWWTATEGVNKAVEVDIMGAKRSAVLHAIGGDDTGWYPIDGKGLGNVDIVAPLMYTDDAHKAEDEAHNHLFTAKIEAEFYYQGGKNEVLISHSDDDSWVFINGKLALDNGGLHGAAPVSVSLDDKAAELGIQPGKKYKIVIFFVDRFFGGAVFNLSYNILFSHCAP